MLQKLSCSYILSVSRVLIWVAITGLVTSPCAAAKSCEDAAPKSWTNEQKERYCQAASSSGWVNPIECAQQARSDLKLKYEDVYMLCVDAVNASPVQCMNSLSKKDRDQYGISLCSRAVSDATSKCWSGLTQYKGKHKLSDPSQIIEFCKELDGTGPTHCVRNAHMVLGIPPSAALGPCSNALMRSDEETMNACLTSLKPHVYTSNANMAARDHGKKGLLDTDAIDFCAAAPSPVSIACFQNTSEMKLSASDRLKLCYGSDSESGPAECFNRLLFDSKKISSTATHEPSDKEGASKSIVTERIALGIQLCAMASGTGPANCFNEGLRMASGGVNPSESVLNAKSGQKNRGVSSSGATGFGDTDHTLLQLCQGSQTPGPVECFRKSQSVFRPVDLSTESSVMWYTSLYGSAVRAESSGRGLGLEMRIHLCLHAPSSAPAECGLKAPQWLAALERVNLCAESSHESLPIRCLQSVEAPAKNFHKAPKKVLGYFLENIADPEAQHARSMAINMCSYASSSNPLASAQCLIKAPPTLKLIDAISLCTNVSVSIDVDGAETTAEPGLASELESAARTDGISASVYLSTCIRLAPRHWSSEDLSTVCKGVRSALEAQGAVSCVQGVMGSVSSLLRIGAHGTQAGALLEPAAATCHAWRQNPKDIPVINATDPPTKKKKQRAPQQQSTGDVGADHYEATRLCVQRAVEGLMSEGRTASPEAIYRVCAGAVTPEPGLCLAKLATQWRMSFEEGADVGFCLGEGALARFGCLLKLPPGRAVSGAAVKRCLVEPVVVTSAKATKLWSSHPDHGPEIQSGIKFTLDVQLYDQWDQPVIGFDNDVSVLVSLNSNNDQGAVLWGTRSNVSQNGIVHFSALSISQPGPVEMKITTRNDASRDGVTKLYLFRMIVRVNPELQDTLYCTFIFRHAQCPSEIPKIAAENWENEFPQESAFFLPSHFIMCSACFKLITEMWGVQLHISPIDGSSIATYRAGVDAIWTGGRGYPNEEMSHEAILELDMSLWTTELNVVKAKHASMLREAKREGSVVSAKASKELLSKLLKVLKKAYYKKSLQWHPDRWSQYPLYADAVTRAFELINEANSELTREITELVAVPAEETDTSEKMKADPVKNPMY